MDRGVEPSRNERKEGFYIALITALLALATLGIAIFTLPASGPFCQSACVEYPYTDIIARFPGDYLWMYPAMLLTLAYVALMACVHHYAPEEKKLFSRIGLCLAVISATVFFADYFVQVSVVQPSLVNGETEGIALLTQYNPHGIFIALEELGFLLMGVAFSFMAPAVSGKTRLSRAIRWIFAIAGALTIGLFLLISASYGLGREYRFEVAVIALNWSVLIASGILLSLLFRRPSGE